MFWFLYIYNKTDKGKWEKFERKSAHCPYRKATQKNIELWTHIIYISYQVFVVRYYSGLFGLVSVFNGISTIFRLFNAKAILLEEK